MPSLEPWSRRHQTAPCSVSLAAGLLCECAHDCCRGLLKGSRGLHLQLLREPHPTVIRCQYAAPAPLVFLFYWPSVPGLLSW